MRASEQHRRHNQETKRLIDIHEQAVKKVEKMASSEGRDVSKSQPWVTSDGALASAAEAVLEARSALDRHLSQSTAFIRNYRILGSEDSSELSRFTVVYEQAPLMAQKQMRERGIVEYRLQEEQPEGGWVSYYPDKHEI